LGKAYTKEWGPRRKGFLAPGKAENKKRPGFLLSGRGRKREPCRARLEEAEKKKLSREGPREITSSRTWDDAAKKAE